MQKIGPHAYDQWADTVGLYGTGKTNEHGMCMLEFGNSYKLAVAKTLFPHVLSRRPT